MGRKKEEKLLSKWYIYRRGWLMFCFSLFHFLFWVLVFGFWFLTVALLAWRVVFLFGWGLGWCYIQHGGKFCPRLDYTTGTCYLFIDEMGGGMEGVVGIGRTGRAGGGVRTLFAENREPTEICHCWPRGGFFCFYEVGWLVVLPYLTLPLS